MDYLRLILLYFLTFGTITVQFSEVPEDFSLTVYIRNAHALSQTYHIMVDAKGRGRYTLFKSGGSHKFGSDGRVVYTEEDVIHQDSFNMERQNVQKIWNCLKQVNYFSLNGDYRKAIGGAYTNLHVTANGDKHRVLNIGMEVQQIREIVEVLSEILPDDISITYNY